MNDAITENSMHYGFTPLNESFISRHNTRKNHEVREPKCIEHTLKDKLNHEIFQEKEKGL